MACASAAVYCVVTQHKANQPLFWRLAADSCATRIGFLHRALPSGGQIVSSLVWKGGKNASSAASPLLHHRSPRGRSNADRCHDCCQVRTHTHSCGEYHVSLASSPHRVQILLKIFHPTSRLGRIQETPCASPRPAAGARKFIAVARGPVVL